MAQLNGITVTSTSSTGTQTLTISGTQYTGRESRGAVFNANSTNLSTNINSSNSLKVTQSGIGPSMSMPDSTVDAAGNTSKEITGSSNLATLKFSGTLAQYLTGARVVVGNQTIQLDVTALKSASGYDMTQSGLNDPGKAALYPVILTFNIPASAPSGDLTGTIGDGTTNKTFKITKSSPVTSDSLTFTSTRSADLVSNDIEITLTSDGNYVSGESRTVKLEASNESIQWTITASNPS